MLRQIITILLVLLTALASVAAYDANRPDVTTPPRRQQTKRGKRSESKPRSKKRRKRVKKGKTADPRLIEKVRAYNKLLKLLGAPRKTTHKMFNVRDPSSQLENIRPQKRLDSKMTGERRYQVWRPIYRCAFRNYSRRLICVCGGGNIGVLYRHPTRTASKPGVTVCGRRYELSETSIRCVQPTAKLTSLPAELGRFEKLTRLHVSVGRLGDVSLLRRLPGLKQLTILVADTRSSVAGLEAIGSLRALTELTLSLRQATPSALRDLRNLGHLHTLTLGGSMRDFSFLAGVAVDKLRLAGSQITDLTALRSLARVRTIDLSRTLVRDLRPLAGLPSLERLELADTPVTDLGSLRKLLHLRNLGLNGTNVRDLTPLYGLRKLWSLSAKRTKVESIAGKPSWPRLAWLELEDTPLRDISGLSGLPSLSSAYLARTRIADLTPLGSCRALKTLSLDNTLVRSVAPLATLERLRTLSLSGTPVSDVRPLLGLKRLGKIDLSNTNKLAQEQIDLLMRSLPCNRQLQSY